MGDKVLLNLNVKFITKLLWQHSVFLNAKTMPRWRQNLNMNEDYRELKNTLEILNTRKRTSRRISTGIICRQIR